MKRISSNGYKVDDKNQLKIGFVTLGFSYKNLKLDKSLPDIIHIV
jgi:hypothetical protein